jgi:hypothetical protein
MPEPAASPCWPPRRRRNRRPRPPQPEQAIRALIKRSEPVTFQAVQREAGVSHAFLYTHPELRG